MVLFGLGTIPMIFAVSLIGNFASIKLRHLINKIIPLVVVIKAYYLFLGD